MKDYICEVRRYTREVFVPLHHAPGHAQADFGEALAVIGGAERKIHFLVVDLPHSDAIFVKAYPRETSEAFSDGHVAAFAFFGGVPQSILYDNTKLAVARILGDGTRLRTQMFPALQSHYLFKDRFGRPAKGNDKGKVEGMVGYIRRNFMVPKPRFESFDALNASLADQCLQRQSDVLRGHKQTIGDRFVDDKAVLCALPKYPFEACEIQSTRVSSLSMVRYRGNDYSVPVAEYDKLAQHCATRNETHVQYLPRLSELELIERERRMIERRIKAAKFPAVKSLDRFDVTVMPSLNKPLVMELARSEYIDRRENIIALGPSGTGTTHVALGLGRAACRQGLKVRFITAASLVRELIEARDDQPLLRLQKQLTGQNLLIIDELGFVPLSKTGAELLFELISQCYECGSIIMTSNLPFDEWTDTFGSERLTGALLDRLTHHVHSLEMNGGSFRLKHSKKRKIPQK